MDVTPGDTFFVIVGCGGKHGTSVGGDGGYPGGGYGTQGDASGGGGGGLVCVFTADPTQGGQPVLCAGSGGGGGHQLGGAGGGETGGKGAGACGNGANANAGGSGTVGVDGAQFMGGNGDSRGSQAGNQNQDGSGGGAGYFGGEGGCSDAGGGGGGSGYCNPSLTEKCSLVMGNEGTQQDTLPPNDADEKYLQGVGVGSKSERDAGDGLVVFRAMEPCKTTSFGYTGEEVVVTFPEDAT